MWSTAQKKVHKRNYELLEMIGAYTSDNLHYPVVFEKPGTNDINTTMSCIRCFSILEGNGLNLGMY